MILERFLVEGPLANYNYLLACPETGECLALDPLDGAEVLKRVKARGWTLRSIVNTHEHPDHTDGNEMVKDATGARVYAHAGARAAIPTMDVGLVAGDVIKVGKTGEVLVLDTPGHTFSHVCLRVMDEGESLFSGDTVFNSGAGNCHFGGDPRTLFQTFNTQIRPLPLTTSLYPGHEYAIRNLGFSLHIDPHNQAAQELLTRLEQEGVAGFVSTLGQEQAINPFLRYGEDRVRQGVARLTGTLPETDEATFVALRKLRNSW